jgi:tetratricopeptide (TPR) repeat protein
MIRFFTLCLLLFFCLLTACGGRNTVRDSDLTVPAVRELSKGDALYRKGCYHESLPYLMRAHERFTALDDLPGVAMSMNNIGNVYRKIGDAESAILFFDSAYAIYTDIGQRDKSAQILVNKAAVLIQEDRLAEAEAVQKTAGGILDESGGSKVLLFSNQGMLLTRKGDYKGAEQLLLQALKACDPQNPAASATVHFSLGKLLTEKGRYDTALDHLQQALSADRATEFYDGIAGDLAAIGGVYERLGDHVAAANYYQRSVKIYALLQDTLKTTETMNLLEASASAANVDIRVTRYFVNKWSKGEMLDLICR